MWLLCKMRMFHKSRLPHKTGCGSCIRCCFLKKWGFSQNKAAPEDEKRRGLGVQDVGLEVFIDYNGALVHLVDSLGTRTLSSLFNEGKWQFARLVKRGDSEVTRSLKSLDAKLPFF